MNFSMAQTTPFLEIPKFIDVDSVSYRFDPQHLALGNVKLIVPLGQFVCLLGPSGCGKTTLLNLIAGFLAPSEGYIFVNGQVVNEPGPDRGMVFQDYSLFPWLTVLQNIEFGPSIAGMKSSERRERAVHYLELVNLGDIAHRYPTQLSGGMKQRVAIARALAAGPKVLLMDEPFAALDAMTRSRLQNELIRIHELERPTIIFVTHNIDEAIRLADRVLVMSPNPGRVVSDVLIDLEKPRARTSLEFARLYDRFEHEIGLESS
jgi:NitT/TauT family transport system ATP-binding protein